MSFQFAGYGRPIDGFCNMPGKMVDASTGEWYWARCGAARKSRCAPCSEIKRGDIAAVGRSGWTDRPVDRAYFCTLTAPGVEVLPWDLELCRHSSGVDCSGSIGCKVEAHALALWHADIGQRWSWFVTDLRRVLGVDVQFFKTWELQSRGALHAHTMLRVGPGISERRFRAAMRLCARRHGFGRQLDVKVVDIADSRQAARTAGYCAKYASKGADDLPAVRRLNVDTGELKSGGVRSWSASRSWGDTMASIKLRRCLWASLRNAGVPSGDGVNGGDPASEASLDLNQNRYALDDAGCSVDLSAALL